MIELFLPHLGDWLQGSYANDAYKAWGLGHRKHDDELLLQQQC